MGGKVIPSGVRSSCMPMVYCYHMTGQRFGVGLAVCGGWCVPGYFIPLMLAAPVASALFPGMVAAGRIYADLVVSEIER